MSHNPNEQDYIKNLLVASRRSHTVLFVGPNFNWKTSAKDVEDLCQALYQLVNLVYKLSESDPKQHHFAQRLTDILDRQFKE